MPSPLLILNGPNLNLLGTREPEITGHETLDDIRALCESAADEHGLTADFRQSNHEGELIAWVQEARTTSSGLIVNAAGLTHTSVSLRDALIACDKPIIEVHLSNIYKRESFRHKSLLSDISLGVICGFGATGYRLAVEAMAAHLK